MSSKRHKPNSTSEIQIVEGSIEHFTESSNELALDLIQSCFSSDILESKRLIELGANAWVQDKQGWTSLHAAASIGSIELINLLLRKGNSVWNITDHLGFTAGDIAYSLNEVESYNLLLQEGIRAEMLKAVLEKMGLGGNDVESEEEEDVDDMNEDDKKSVPIKLSTAGDNATFLASPLIFTKDDSGQEICIDIEGNGVMMAWEKDLMKVTAEKICKPFENRKGRVVDINSEEEEEMNVVNVGFGLGIIDTLLQEYSPTFHLIIEPHPDVLAHAKSKGFDKLPGVKFYEGTWQQYLKDLEDEKEEYKIFDVIYFDTYSEKYQDLHEFFDVLPNWLRSTESHFSFFNGLGATSRSFYEIYTEISELHLNEIGLNTEWFEVDLSNATGAWEGVERRYWGDVGPYRLPCCRLNEIIM